MQTAFPWLAVGVHHMIKPLKVRAVGFFVDADNLAFFFVIA